MRRFFLIPRGVILPKNNKMKVALVYDRVNKWGGAERLLLALGQIWPQAPLYTAVYDAKNAPWAKRFKVIPSFLNKIPLAKSHHEKLALLMPLAFESLNFDSYEVVISLTSEAAKGIITKPETLHLSYCLTPTRYLWSGYGDYFSSPIYRFLALPGFKYLRHWDKIAAQRPDFYFAISKNVQKRIKKYYQRHSEIIYPPLDLHRFKISTVSKKPHDYFLIVSRMVSYKRIDLAIEAFNQLGWPLKIVGLGRQFKKLQKMAKKNIEFLGQLTDEELLGYYQNCQAVIFPPEEDLGLVPLEAQACGRPVIAYRGGGALETISEGKTGLFFYPQTSQGLLKALKSFKTKKFKPENCRQNAEKFSQARFKKEFKKAVLEKWRNIQS